MVIKLKAWGAAASVPVALALAAPAFASADYFLKIETSGPGAAAMQVESWSWGASNPGSGKGTLSVRTAREAGSGMAIGRIACARDTRYPTATLSRGAESWTLRDVVVSACGEGTITLAYAAAVKATKSRSNIQNN